MPYPAHDVPPGLSQHSIDSWDRSEVEIVMKSLGGRRLFPARLLGLVDDDAQTLSSERWYLFCNTAPVWVTEDWLLGDP